MALLKMPQPYTFGYVGQSSDRQQQNEGDHKCQVGLPEGYLQSTSLISHAAPLTTHRQMALLKIPQTHTFGYVGHSSDRQQQNERDHECQVELPEGYLQSICPW